MNEMEGEILQTGGEILTAVAVGLCNNLPKEMREDPLFE